MTLEAWIRATTNATTITRGQRIQSLWSGYGEIVRYHLTGAPQKTVIVKRVEPPRNVKRDRGYQRKLTSYAVELAFYRNWSSRCSSRVPRLLGSDATADRTWFLLEDLDAAGFSARRPYPSDDAFRLCLDWLAAFHATFLDAVPTDLWSVGTYWHLDTRPIELAAMTDRRLKQAAAALDARLSDCPYLTLVHGDAKPANFCFTPDTTAVAAVDFQYVGGGCGMKDVAYLLGCLRPADSVKLTDGFLDHYFASLRANLQGTSIDLDHLEHTWRALYPTAWADFARFLDGWAPQYLSRNAYSRNLTKTALRSL